MPSVDDLLRAELGQMGDVVGADSARMLTRVTSARRRRAALTAGAAVVVLAAGTAGVIAFRGPSDSAPMPADAASSEPAGEDGPISNINGIGFAGDKAYTLWQICTSSGTECVWQLYGSGDSGRSWQRRTVPADLVVRDEKTFELPQLAVLAPDTVMVQWLALQPWWISRDGARTWSQTQPPPSDPVATIPEGGATVVIASRSTSGEMAGARIHVGGPDGVGGVLENGPGDDVRLNGIEGFDRSSADAVAATDGSFWLPCIKTPGGTSQATATGRDEDVERQACVTVTRDRGRTWQTITPKAKPERGLSPGWVSTVDGRTVYAGIRAGRDDNVENVEVYRSTDAGVTWSALQLPKYGVEGQLVVGFVGARALPNGDLIAVADGKMYRAAAGKSALQPVADAPKDVEGLVSTGSGLAAVTFPAHRPLPEQTLIYVSRDGIHWTGARLP